MNRKLFFLLVLFPFLAEQVKAQRTDEPWQLDLSAGLASFYAPVKGLHYSRPEPVVQAGWGKPIGKKQTFCVTLQVGYARNNYQGDAVYLQLMPQYTPVIAKKLELGLGLGFGYRLAMYPSKPLLYEAGTWKQGRSYKGVYQVPLQLSVGYRSIQVQQYSLRPYLAYQLQGLFRYSPDLSPLPVSIPMLGVKIQKP